jgi:hypothetical protein
VDFGQHLFCSTFPCKAQRKERRRADSNRCPAHYKFAPPCCVLVRPVIGLIYARFGNPEVLLCPVRASADQLQGQRQLSVKSAIYDRLFLWGIYSRTKVMVKWRTCTTKAQRSHVGHRKPGRDTDLRFDPEDGRCSWSGLEAPDRGVRKEQLRRRW